MQVEIEKGYMDIYELIYLGDLALRSANDPKIDQPHRKDLEHLWHLLDDAEGKGAWRVLLTYPPEQAEKVARLLLHLVPALQTKSENKKENALPGLNSSLLQYGLMPDEKYEFLDQIHNELARATLLSSPTVPQAYRLIIGQDVTGKMHPEQPNDALLLLVLALLLEPEGRPKMRLGINLWPPDYSHDRWVRHFWSRANNETVKAYVAHPDDYEVVKAARKEVGEYLGLLTPIEKRRTRAPSDEERVLREKLKDARRKEKAYEKQLIRLKERIKF